MERHPNRNEPPRQAWPRPHGNPHGDHRGGSDAGSSRDRDEDHGPSAADRDFPRGARGRDTDRDLRRFAGEGADPFDDHGYRDHDARDRDPPGDSGGSYRAGYGGDRDIHVGPRSANGDHGRSASEPAWRHAQVDEFHDHSDDDHHDRYAGEHRGDPRASRSYLSDRDPRYHSDDASDHDRYAREYRDDHDGDSGPIAQHRHRDLDEHRVHFDRERPGAASDRLHDRSGPDGTGSRRDRGGHDADDHRHLDDPRARGGYRGDDLSDRSPVAGTGNFGGRSAYGNPLGYGGSGTYDGGYEDSGPRDPAYARSAPRGEHRDVRGEHRDVRGEHRDARGEHRDVRGEHRDVRGEHRDVRSEHRDVRGEHGDARGEHRDARGEHRDHDERRHHRGAGREDHRGRH